MDNLNGTDTEQGEAVVVQDSATLQALTTSEIETQIRTAKRYPRSIQKFQRDAMTLATLDEDTASSMFYRVPRDSKQIEGGSVRLAEICGSSWGNCHIGARVVDIGDRMLSAQAVAWDLEKNFKVVVEIRRGIINRFGRRYSDDMIRTTAQAAMSIALRNAIFRIVSPALVKPILEEAKKVSVGKNQTMEQRRANAFKAMKSVGAKDADVLRVLGKRGLEDLDLEDIITLRGWYTAIKDNEATWESILADFESVQPKSDADIQRGLKTQLDDVEIVATNNPSPQDTKSDPEAGSSAQNQENAADRPLTDEDRKMADDMWNRKKAALSVKRDAIRKVLPNYSGVDSLKTQRDLELFGEALDAIA